ILSFGSFLLIFAGVRPMERHLANEEWGTSSKLLVYVLEEACHWLCIDAIKFRVGRVAGDDVLKQAVRSAHGGERAFAKPFCLLGSVSGGVRILRQET